MIEVTQADREAAAELIETYWSGADAQMMKLAASYRNGHSQGAFVRILARHRTTAEAAKDARIKELEAALRQIAERDLLEVEGYRKTELCIPETGSVYEGKEPVFKRTAWQNATEFQAISRAALKEIDNG